MAQLGKHSSWKTKEALEYAKRAVLSPESLDNLSLAYLANDEYHLALREARRAKEIQAFFETSSSYEGVTLYHMGRYDEAKTILQKLSVPWAGLGPIGTVALAEIATGDTRHVAERFSQLKERKEAVLIGLLHAALGEKELALQSFENSDRWDYWPTLSVSNFFKPLLDAFTKEERYQKVLENPDL